MSKTKFHKALPLLAASWFLTCGGSTCKDSSDDGPGYVPGEVFAVFVAGTTESEVEALASDLGIQIRRIYFYPESSSQVDSAVFVVPEGEELEWIAVIEESPIVDSAYHNHTGSIPEPGSGCSAGM